MSGGAEGRRARDVAELRDLALAVAREAGALVLGGWGRSGPVRSKDQAVDLVTEWDTRSESLIRARLRALAGAIPVLGEEEGGEAAGRERWLVDPIDGTVNFAHGLPIFAVSIAYEREGQLLAGAVVAPALGQEFAAAAAHGATMNGERLGVSATPRLGQALLATGFPYDRAVSPENNFAEFVHLQRRAGAVRRLGSAALDLCYVARGWFDGYWELKVKPWDIGAGAVIVREAGGRLSALGGGPFAVERGEVLATNGLIHDELAAALAEVRGRSAAS